mmetsp:Transcript_26020/g.65014  ORF Transcript_26020/g.65014 Transcript_26020/m.65014 type:complete len:266 (-) Transcript_26020:352-1149(-)
MHTGPLVHRLCNGRRQGGNPHQLQPALRPPQPGNHRPRQMVHEPRRRPPGLPPRARPARHRRRRRLHQALHQPRLLLHDPRHLPRPLLRARPQEVRLWRTHRQGHPHRQGQDPENTRRIPRTPPAQRRLRHSGLRRRPPGEAQVRRGPRAHRSRPPPPHGVHQLPRRPVPLPGLQARLLRRHRRLGRHHPGRLPRQEKRTAKRGVRRVGPNRRRKGQGREARERKVPPRAVALPLLPPDRHELAPHHQGRPQARPEGLRLRGVGR